MEFPINIHLLGATINAHLVFELLAYMLGFRYYLYLRNKSEDKINSENRIWIMIAAAAGAAVGSKALGILEHIQTLPWQDHQIWYSKTIVGGLLGGLFAVEFAKKILKIRHSSGDLFCFPIILGIAIGRIGCFTQGVYDGTHGIASDFWLAMDMGDGISRHPTQLYEIIFLVLLFFILKKINHKFVLEDGALFKLFMVSYLLWRLVIDTLKPIDTFQPVGLSAIQIACLLGLIYYWPVIFKPKLLIKYAN